MAGTLGSKVQSGRNKEEIYFVVRPFRALKATGKSLTSILRQWKAFERFLASE